MFIIVMEMAGMVVAVDMVILMVRGYIIAEVGVKEAIMKMRLYIVLFISGNEGEIKLGIKNSTWTSISSQQHTPLLCHLIGHPPPY